LLPYQNQETVERFITETRNNDYVITPICNYEILWHLLRKNATTQLMGFNEIYKKSSATLSMNEAAFVKAAEIRAELERTGNPIGDADFFIAAYCIVNGYTLVTNNTKDFERIDGLKLTNWK
jgi:tRNA(fMet)-specific endonuclease VapC